MAKPPDPPRYSRPGRGLVPAVGLCLSAGCAAVSPPSALTGPTPTNAHERAMARLAVLAVDRLLELAPVEATRLGYPKYSDRLPDVSPRGVRRTDHALEALARELGRIDERRLGRAWALDRALLVDAVERRRFELNVRRPFGREAHYYTQTAAAALHLLARPTRDRRADRERLSALVARVEGLDAFLGAARTNLENPSRLSVDAAVAETEGLVAALTSSLTPAFAGHPDLLARFEAARSGAVRAVRSFGTFLKTEVAPRAARSWRLGAAGYRRTLAHRLGTDLDPRTLLDRARADLDATRRRLAELATAADEEGAGPAARAQPVESLRTAPPIAQALEADEGRADAGGPHAPARIARRLEADESPAAAGGPHAPTRLVRRLEADRVAPRASLGDRLRTELEELIAVLDARHLVSRPDPAGTPPLAVEPAPPYVAGDVVAFFEPASPFSPEPEGRLWFGAGGDGVSDGRLRFVAAHEGVPGHHLLDLLSRTSAIASVTKRALACRASRDGWAALVVPLLLEADPAPASRSAHLLHLRARLRTIALAMVDARLHLDEGDEAAVERWALRLMTEQAEEDEAFARQAVRRAKLRPTDLARGYVGLAAMEDLYAREQARAGDAFDRRAFLDRLGGCGALPPRILARCAVEGVR